MGLHTGEPAVGDEGYVGIDVVRAARICAAGHGGQILLSETTQALLGGDLPAGTELRDLGEQQLKDVRSERVFQLALDEGPRSFPALKAQAPDDLGRFERQLEALVERELTASIAGRRARGLRRHAVAHDADRVRSGHAGGCSSSVRSRSPSRSARSSSV